MTLSEFGAQVRKDRLAKGLSLYKAAVLARVHPNSVMLCERGATSKAMAERISRALQAVPASEAGR